MILFKNRYITRTGFYKLFYSNSTYNPKIERTIFCYIPEICIRTYNQSFLCIRESLDFHCDMGGYEWINDSWHGPFAWEGMSKKEEEELKDR